MRGRPLGEGAHARRRRALGAAHVEREPHHQPAGGVGGEQRAQGLEIAPAPHAPDHPQPLRRDAELIAHRHADPRLAHVEGRDPHASRLTPAPRGRNAAPGRRVPGRCFR